MGLWERLFAFGKVVSSSIGKTNSSVAVSIRVTGDDDAETDGAPEEPLFGATIFRPLDADAAGAAEVVTTKAPDQLLPLAVRDLRRDKARGNVNKGTTCLPGYKGGFVEVGYDAGSGTDTITAYLPDGGSPVKASLLSMTKNQVLLLHKLGAYVVINEAGQVMLASPSGQVFITIDDSGLALSGPIKMVTGALIGDVGAALPLVNAPPGSALWFGQMMAAVNVMVGKFNAAAGPMLSAPGTAIAVTAPPPTIATKAAAS